MPKLKINVLPEHLKEAARRVSSIPSPSSPMETYHYLSLVATPDKPTVRVYATNGQAAAIALVQDATKEGSGQIVLQAQQFMSIVGSLATAASFTIADSGKITMDSSGWKCKLPSIETVLQSPVLRETNHSITLRIEPLVHAVECAISAIGKGVVQGYDVDSAVFDFTDHTKPRILSSDGKQLVVVSLPVVSQEPHEGSAIKLPATSCKAFLQFFSGSEGLVKLKYDGNVLCAWNDSGVIYMLQAGGRVFPVDSVVNAVKKADYSRIVVPKREFVQAIRRAGIALKGDDSKQINLQLSGKTLLCTC